MKAEENQQVQSEPPLLDPVAILTQELNNKAIKKAAIQSISTIALVLTPRQIKNDLVPLLIKTFVQEVNQMRILIIKSLARLLQFLTDSNQVLIILEFIIDILCVFSEEEIRKQAGSVFEDVMKSVNIEDTKDQIMKVIEQLSKETDSKISEVVLKLSRHLYAASSPEQQSIIIQRINQYKESQQGQLTLCLQLTHLIKITPSFPLLQIEQIFRSLVTSSNIKVRSKLIEPLLLLAATSAKNTAKQCLSILLQDKSSDVVSSVILHAKEIRALFPAKEDQEYLWRVVDSYAEQDLTVKTAIIEVLQQIPLTPRRRTAILQNHNSSQSLNLNKTLANSLCKIEDLQGLKVIIDSSDTEFKNKLFPKLPPTCELHLQLMQHLFAQKNWRNKLSLLQNIQKRLEDGQAVEIMLPKLLSQMGDRIAVFRIGIVKLIASIIKTKRIELRQYKKFIEQSLHSKNWFERQSAYLLLQDRVYLDPIISKSDRQFIVCAVRHGLQQRIQNIRQICRQIANKLRLKLD